MIYPSVCGNCNSNPCRCAGGVRPGYGQAYGQAYGQGYVGVGGQQPIIQHVPVPVVQHPIIVQKPAPAAQHVHAIPQHVHATPQPKVVVQPQPQVVVVQQQQQPQANIIVRPAAAPLPAAPQVTQYVVRAKAEPRPVCKYICFCCNGDIYGKDVIKCYGHTYHRGCLKCSFCMVPLTASAAQFKDGKLACRGCYERYLVAIHPPKEHTHKKEVHHWYIKQKERECNECRGGCCQDDCCGSSYDDCGSCCDCCDSCCH